ncbi:glutathione S-transferase family protein [Belnapia sp. T6]|uniref:Glutathione S-transferase family protein n=1 Tax=Belnapia mucosa TaxID=2804532 RepID=A0ABS1VC85_9PROT|nr:glutathione S-transferase family protein [Belnapia mucosa]MBL6459300.1 glutathione S-transferase family protein [Belnapia mucosa]
MLTLFSYPGLFGLADNNPYGLKVFAVLKLCGLGFRQDYTVDASAAPRGQLPYLRDGEMSVGDSDGIIAHLTRRHGLALDAGMTARERAIDLMIRRTLDDLYWVMSFSRWKDDRFWPLFRDAMLAAVPGLSSAVLDVAREYNFQRYHYQGIGRFEPEQAYARGIADLDALAELLPGPGFLFGAAPHSADAGLYGFLANILFYPIETPLKAHLVTKAGLVAHCRALHALIGG